MKFENKFVFVAITFLFILMFFSSISITGEAPRKGKAACNDGIDNDGDGYIDMDDAGCRNRADKDENNCGDLVCSPYESPDFCSIDCKKTETNTTCISYWQCSQWGSCSSSGIQTRSCTDLNSCGTSTGKPSEVQSCTYTPPSDDTTGLPDLTFLSTYFIDGSGNDITGTTVRVGDNVRIFSDVKNQGSSDIAVSTWLIQGLIRKDSFQIFGYAGFINFDNNLNKDYVPAGSSYIVYRDLTYQLINYGPGTYCYDIMLDPTNAVVESDENNNIVSNKCINVIA